MRRAKVLAVVLAASASTAFAGGTQRPNLISARGVGMGGAWTAWADDATAIYFNPGALDTINPHVMIGGEFVLGPRSYTPRLADGSDGDPQKTLISSPVPALGIVGRFSEDGEPSRFTLGLGAWNTFGGRVSYPNTGMPALDTTQDLCFEVNGAVGFRVSDRLSLGATVRVGAGFFRIVSTANPFDADLSASGVGAGLAAGALFRPTETVRVGLTWRSPLRIQTKGSGTVEQNGTTETHAIEHQQNWPQQVSLGVGVQASSAVKLAFQADWSQWSQIDTIELRFPNGGLPDQIYPEYWSDNWSLRVGADFAVAQSVALRAGTYYDSPAVPDRTLERQYSDSHKVGVSVGASFHAAGWRFDTAADGIIPRTHTVENNVADVMGVSALQNKAPGEYFGSLITFELAAARQF